MSKKKQIFDILSTSGIPVSYSIGASSAKPYMIMSFVSLVSTRLSGKKHDKHARYQVMYYSDRALDAETDAKLLEIEANLEADGFLTTDWMEITDSDEDEEIYEFAYLLEVM